MNPLRYIYYCLGPKGRLWVRKTVYFPIDLFDGMTGRRDDMTPKKGDIYVGSGDFREQGRRFVRLLRDLACLRPDHTVLDVGSGIGRLAVALTEYLSPEGHYEGFDVVRKGVDWCDSHITPRFPNFSFRFVNLRNDLYNHDTKDEARNYAFPYGDNTFDCVVLTSVFTHMMPADVENYIGQINRVMKPSGKCLATFFIVDDDVRKQMEQGKAYFRFTNDYKSYLLLSDKVKEANIAYPIETIWQFARQHGLTIEQSYRGSWTGLVPEAQARDFQDILIFSKNTDQ